MVIDGEFVNAMGSEPRPIDAVGPYEMPEYPTMPEFQLTVKEVVVTLVVTSLTSGTMLLLMVAWPATVEVVVLVAVTVTLVALYGSVRTPSDVMEPALVVQVTPVEYAPTPVRAAAHVTVLPA